MLILHIYNYIEIIHFEENLRMFVNVIQMTPFSYSFHELWNNLIFQVIKLIPLCVILEQNIFVQIMDVYDAFTGKS